MSGTPDILTQFGGQPVGADHRFDGWWGGKVYFSDFDNGTAGATGLNDMAAPGKDMQRAIDDAGVDATVYVRPRAFSSEDPQQITPSSDDAENFHIDAAKANLSLIGTGKGLSHAAAHKAWIGGYSGLTTAVLRINAPGCVIEGFRAQPPASAAQGIFYTINDGTYDGGNTTFINNDFHDGPASGALILSGTWQMAVKGNRFLNCDIGISFITTYSAPQIIDISHNYFNAITSEISADIHCSGGPKRLSIYDNKHAAGQPTGGANKYIHFGAAATGMVSGCYFGVDDTTEATLMTLNGVLQAGNHSAAGLVT